MSQTSRLCQRVSGLVALVLPAVEPAFGQWAIQEIDDVVVGNRSAANAVSADGSLVVRCPGRRLWGLRLPKRPLGQRLAERRAWDGFSQSPAPFAFGVTSGGSTACGLYQRGTGRKLRIAARW